MLSLSVLLLLGVPMSIVALPSAPPRLDPVTAITQLIERVLPEQSSRFTLTLIPTRDGRDVMQLASDGAQIVVRGSSAIALASAFNWYLNDYLHTTYDWNTYTLTLPKGPLPLPPAAGTALVPRLSKWSAYDMAAVFFFIHCLSFFLSFFFSPLLPTFLPITQTASPIPFIYLHFIMYSFLDPPPGYYMNVCTYGYSLGFVGWDYWIKHLDWMALNGINLPLAFVGQEMVMMRVFMEHYNLTLADMQAFFSGPAFLPACSVDGGEDDAFGDTCVYI